MTALYKISIDQGCSNAPTAISEADGPPVYFRLFRGRTFPEQPAAGRDELQSCGQPQRRLHATAATTQPTARDRTHQQRHHTSDTTIALDIGRGLVRDLRIRGNIEIDTGENHGGNLVETKRAATSHGTRGLKGEQCDRNQL